MLPPLIEADTLTVRRESQTVLEGISFTIRRGEAWAVVGPSGSGKSTLARVIAHHLPVFSGSLKRHLASDESVVMVEPQHAYRNRTDASATYYQARFESLNAEEFPTVEEELAKSCATDATETEQRITEVLTQLGLLPLRYTRLIQLSNGENKRFQLAKALVRHPTLLILDTPFVGLDTASRALLHEVIEQLISQNITLLLVTSPSEIPAGITRVMELREGRVVYQGKRAAYVPPSPVPDRPPSPKIDTARLAALSREADRSFDVAVRMRNVTVQYGGKRILNGINWEIRRGDKWSLTGPNGAGKSTLLSLIHGDNPQAYANDITLFDRPRGSGESIWDIKRRIGYVSPELHAYFDRRLRCFEVVASGLTNAGHRKIRTSQQDAIIHQWLAIFGLTRWQHDPMRTMPLSEQRRTLLARALVKNPPLLILDEPCQGLDAAQTQQFTALVDTVCQQTEKTLIFVSHYPNDIPRCVDWQLVLEKGKARVVMG